jgi:hypothetical protein
MKFITQSQYVRKYGVSYQRINNWINENKIDTRRVEDYGVVRILVQDALPYLSILKK